MGFPLGDVLTSDALVEEFQCKICHNLVEYAQCSHTSCGHVFCEGCLSDWMARSADPETRAEAAMNGANPVAGTRCPTCNAPLPPDAVSTLKSASPLAWRLLGRVRVRCPLHASGCSWRGDLSEVSAHLTNSQSHLGGKDYAADLSQANAEALKDQGNAKFQARAYREAIQLYSKAISAAPGVAAYYGNRAAAWLHIGAAEACAEDCRRAVAIDPGYVKGHLRLAKALCEMSDVDGARAALRRATKSRPGDETLAAESARMATLAARMSEGSDALREGDPARALAAYTAAMRISECAAVTLGAARAEAASGRCDRASRLSLRVIKADPKAADAYAVRGYSLCLAADFDQGIKHLRESLRLDPDHGEASRLHRRMKRAGSALEAGRAAAARRDFDSAAASFTESMAAAEAPIKSPLAAVTLGERANAKFRLKALDDAIRDAEAAIASQEDHKPAYFTMAHALVATGRAEEAAARLKTLVEMDPSDETCRRHHEKAVFEVRKARRPDYYQILGVSALATVPEIKQAYKRKCMEWHPDRHAGAPEEQRAAAEKNFKALGEALEIMEDQMKRQLYDQGYDKEAIAERAEAARRAAHRGGHGCGGGGGCC